MGLASLIETLCENLSFNFQSNCCTGHEYRSARLPSRVGSKLHLDSGEVVVLIGKRIIKFPSIDSCHKFLHESEEDIEGCKPSCESKALHIEGCKPSRASNARHIPRACVKEGVYLSKN